MARTYTQPEKDHAVNLYVQHGLAEAHHRTGIPKASLQRWAETAGHNLADLSGRTAEKTKAASEQHRLAMAEMRTKAQAEFAKSALHAAVKVREAEKGNDAQGWATASAIMTDKLRLELGEATDRTEHIAVPERTVEAQEEMDRTLRLVQDMAA